MFLRSRAAQVHLNLVMAQMQKKMPNVMVTAPKYRGPLPPPPAPPGVPLSEYSTKDHHGKSLREVVDQHAASSPPPPKKKRHTSQSYQHCRFYNFGKSTCHLANCNFAHVDTWNYDIKEGRYVEKNESHFVTEEVVSKLAEVHVKAIRKLRQEKEQKQMDSVSVYEVSDGQQEDQQQELEEMSSQLLQIWLDSARQEEMQENSVFNRDRVTLTFHGFEDKVRFPFEEAVWQRDNGDVSLTMRRKTHVTWSCMLYGKRKGVMKHLQSCLLLGYKLRYELKPLLLKKYNIEFENVLFVTETALDECSFRACSFVWSMVFKDIPKVHESRLAGTSKHLIGEETHAAHLFLKVEAFKMPAELSVLSDLDLVVTEPELLAEAINRFHKPVDKDAKIFPAGAVMVMQRNLSKAVFDSDPVRITQTDWSSWHLETGQMPVSYCWAFIRPTTELTQRYEAVMQAPAQNKGLLSDQDLLAEVISTEFTMAHHNIIAFPSWFVHSDICEKRAQEVMESNMKHDKKQLPWRAHGAGLIAKVGAFHLSKSFDFDTCALNLETKKAGWVKSMKISPWDLKNYYVWPKSHRKETFHDYIEVLSGFWVALHEEHKKQLSTLTTIIVDSVDELTPGLGMMKGLVALLKTR
jgi:hypothetical protein